MADPLIRLEHIDKQYEGGQGLIVPVLKNINLTIQAGEFVCLMGHSGSGKSTLMNILGCLDAPTRGDYFFEGRLVSGMTSDELAALRNRKLGFVFQGFNLLKRMTTIDNVALPLIYAGTPRKEALGRAQEKLVETGLGSFADRLPNQLSGGQQQRVAIARALIVHPMVLLADEPTGNLDTATSQEIMSLIRGLNHEANITVILVTHEQDIAAYGKRLIRLKDGEVVHDAPIETSFA